jgi:hypothetical protein
LKYFYWTVEERIPVLGNWRPVHVPNEDADDMSEEDADALIDKYRRAMPMKEFRKRATEFDPEAPTEDIPF